MLLVSNGFGVPRIAAQAGTSPTDTPAPKLIALVPLVMEWHQAFCWLCFGDAIRWRSNGTPTIHMKEKQHERYKALDQRNPALHQ